MKQFKTIYNQLLKIDKCTITNCIYVIMAPFSVLGVLLFLFSAPIMIDKEAEKSAGNEASQKSENTPSVLSKIDNTLQKVNSIGLTFLSGSN